MNSAAPNVQKLVDLLTNYIPLREKNEAETRAMADEDFTGEAFDKWYAEQGAEMRKIEESIVEATQEAIEALDDHRHPANDRIYQHFKTLGRTHALLQCSTLMLNHYKRSLTMWIERTAR